MNLVGSELQDKIKYFCNVWYPAREAIEIAIKDRYKVSFKLCISCFINLNSNQDESLSYILAFYTSTIQIGYKEISNYNMF